MLLAGRLRRAAAYRWLTIAGAAAWLAAVACDRAASGSDGPETGPSPPAAVATSLSGRVVSTTGASPIVGAAVAIVDGPNGGRQTTTGTDGLYMLSDLQPGNANVSATAAGYQERRAGVTITGASTLNFELVEVSPLVTFGAGEHRVGADIPAGQYYSDPAAGCSWERRSAEGRTIASAFVDFDAVQWIVDVRAGDRSFQTNAACGTWSNRARAGTQTAIAPGVWRVGTQVPSGTYSSSATAGCHWQRLSNFGGGADAVIASDLIASSGTAFVTIFPSDTGFRSTPACGSWGRSTAAGGSAATGH